MKIAYSNLSSPGWTMERTVQAVKEYGYDGLELRLLDGEVIKPDLDKASREKIARLCKEAGVSVICLDTSVTIAQPDPEKRAAQVRDGLAMLEMAAQFSAPLIRVFPGPPEGTPQADAIAGAVDCLAKLAKRGEELGVSAVIETHDAFSSSDAVSQVLRQVPSKKAGILWDVLNSMPFWGKMSMDQAMNFYREGLLHVHFKDGFFATPENGNKWKFTLLGQGQLPTVDVLKGLKQVGYQGWVSVEWEKKWHMEIEEPEVALPQYSKLLRQYMAAL